MTGRIRGCVLAAGFCAAVFSAFADDDPYAGYVRLTASDSSSVNSYNKAGNWSDGLAPSGDKNYYVPAGLKLIRYHPDDYTDDAYNIWNGGQLVVAGTLYSQTTGGNNYGGLLITNLVLLGGSELRISTYGPFYCTANTATSEVTVASTPGNPAWMTHQYPTSGSRHNALYARFKGDADSELVYFRGITNASGASIDRGWYTELPTYALGGFNGKFIVRGEHSIVKPQNSIAFNLPNMALQVDQGGEFYPQKGDSSSRPNAYFRSFDVRTGGRMNFYYTSSMIVPLMNVTEGFSVDEDAVFIIGNLAYTYSYVNGISPSDPYGKLKNSKFALLSGTAAETVGDLPMTNFVFLLGTKIPKLNYRLHAYDNGDGTKEVWLTAPDVVCMTNKNVETKSDTSWCGSNPPGTPAYGAFESGHAGDWTNLETPPANSSLHYMCKVRICFHQITSQPNATLTMCADSSYKGGSTQTFKEVNHLSSCAFGMWGSPANKRLVAQRWNVVGVSAKNNTDVSQMYVSGNDIVTLDADVCGDCGFMIRNNGDGVGSISLTHINTNFHGRLTIAQGVTKTGTSTHGNFTTTLADARNWGGVFTSSANTYDAITITNFPKVSVTGNADFNEPTRGMYIKMGVTFDVKSGKTLRLANQVTYAGVIEKTGDGTLDLAGTARFIDGAEATAPVADTNVVSVAGGALRISSDAAADGLALVFAEGTKLVVPADSAHGYFNTKWATPLTVNTTSGRLTVEIEPADEGDLSDIAVPVCTFAAAAAEGLSASVFDVRRMSNGLSFKGMEKRTNGDGTVSFVARMGRVGANFMIR